MLTIILLAAIIALATYIAYRITCYFDSNHASIIGELMDLQDKHALLQKQYEFILEKWELQVRFNALYIESLRKIEKHMSTPLDLSTLIALSDGSIVRREPEPIPERDWRDFSGVKVGDQVIVKMDSKNMGKPFVDEVKYANRKVCEFVFPIITLRCLSSFKMNGTGIYNDGNKIYHIDDPNAPKLSQ